MQRITTFASAIALAATLSSSTALLSTAAHAQTDRQESEAAELPGPDTKFVALALVGGLGEVQISQLAAENASSAEVKQLAERIVSDHATLNTQLQALADEHKIAEDGTKGTPPLEVSPEDKEVYEALSRLTGDEFDRAYIEHLVAKHQTDIALYREEIESGEDKEVKSLAEQALPVLEEHLQLAQTLATATQ